jgi:hypothetical protein
MNKSIESNILLFNSGELNNIFKSFYSFLKKNSILKYILIIIALITIISILVILLYYKKDTFSEYIDKFKITSLWINENSLSFSEIIKNLLFFNNTIKNLLFFSFINQIIMIIIINLLLNLSVIILSHKEYLYNFIYKSQTIIYGLNFIITLQLFIIIILISLYLILFLWFTIPNTEYYGYIISTNFFGFIKIFFPNMDLESQFHYMGPTNSTSKKFFTDSTETSNIDKIDPNSFEIPVINNVDLDDESLALFRVRQYLLENQETIDPALLNPDYNSSTPGPSTEPQKSNTQPDKVEIPRDNKRKANIEESTAPKAKRRSPALRFKVEKPSWAVGKTPVVPNTDLAQFRIPRLVEGEGYVYDRHTQVLTIKNPNNINRFFNEDGTINRSLENKQYARNFLNGIKYHCFELKKNSTNYIDMPKLDENANKWIAEFYKQTDGIVRKDGKPRNCLLNQGGIRNSPHLRDTIEEYITGTDINRYKKISEFTLKKK